jgi:hypothetical protein
MKNQFVPYEEALALKELGFDIPVTLASQTAYYRIKKDSEEIDEISCNEGYKKMFNEDIYTLRPLYQQAFRWFDENYPRYTALLDAGHNERFSWKILDDGDEKYGYESEPSDSRLDVELACLRKLIEIVNQNKDDNT